MIGSLGSVPEKFVAVPLCRKEHLLVVPKEIMAELAGDRLEVVWAPGVREKALAEGRSEEWLDGLAGVLSSDPRPAYQTDPEKIYGMRYADAEVSFSAEETRLIIRDVRGA